MQHRKAAYLNIRKIFTSTGVYHFKFENSTHPAQFTLVSLAAVFSIVTQRS